MGADVWSVPGDDWLARPRRAAQFLFAKSSIQKWSVLDRLLRNTFCIRSKHLLNAVIELRSIMLVEGCLHPFGGRSDALSVGWAIIIESACLTDSCQTVLSSGEDPR